MPTVFYSQIDPTVVKALDTRKAYYGSMERTTAAHSWLNQKMAWASAHAFIVDLDKDSKDIFTLLADSGDDISKLPVKSKSSLTLPVNGGFAKRTGGEITNAGLYNRETADQDVGRWSVKPHINKVIISNDGDWGSTKKAEINFSVYNRADLSKQIAFLTIGAYVEISYGWSTNTGAEGAPGKYKGIVYNFSYNVNEYGGFDCTVSLIGPGFSLFAMHANGSLATDLKFTDAANGAVYASTLVGLLRHIVIQSKPYLTSATGPENIYNGIGLLEPITSPKDSSKINPIKDETVKNYYISLERLVSVVNYIFQTAGGKVVDLNDITISNPIACNSIYTRVAPINQPEKLVSASPLECIFPGFYSYATKNDSLINYVVNPDYINDKYRFVAYENACREGDASKIMISIDWIINLIDDMSDPKQLMDRKFSDFFTVLLNMIHQNSGERWSLAVVQDPTDPYKFYISDVSYVNDNISTYKITSVTKDGISRTSSLLGKIPSELAAAAQVAAITAMTSDARGLATIYKNIEPSTGQSGLYIKSDTERLMEDLAQSKINVVARGVTIENVNKLRADLKGVYLSEQPGQDMSKIRIPFGLDFTFTLDGIEGIVFGNAITSNYLPEIYSADFVSFTVTKVIHVIADNDWLTTVNTVCRVQL